VSSPPGALPASLAVVTRDHWIVEGDRRSAVVHDRDFRWLLPGERRLAFWGAGRVRKVQGDSRQLVAGAYVILAAMWGSLGGIVGLVSVVLDFARGAAAGYVLPVVAIALCRIGMLRLIQSRNARRCGEP
jgi:hypothetical protein